MAGKHRGNVITPEVRKAVLERAGYRCERCRAAAPLQHPLWCGLDVHHLHPWAQGGGSTPENLRALCVECHDDHGRSGLSFKEWLEQPGPNREEMAAKHVPRGPGLGWKRRHAKSD